MLDMSSEWSEPVTEESTSKGIDTSGVAENPMGLSSEGLRKIRRLVRSGTIGIFAMSGRPGMAEVSFPRVLMSRPEPG
jgi:hypothetical protein